MATNNTWNQVPINIRIKFSVLLLQVWSANLSIYITQQLFRRADSQVPSLNLNFNKSSGDLCAHKFEKHWSKPSPWSDPGQHWTLHPCVCSGHPNCSLIWDKTGCSSMPCSTSVFLSVPFACNVIISPTPVHLVNTCYPITHLNLLQCKFKKLFSFCFFLSLHCLSKVHFLFTSSHSF